MEEFKKLGISEESFKAIEKKGFTLPTSIQSQVIPLLLKGKKDIVGKSQTGTGKTVSFGIPILDNLRDRSKGTQAIILTPTRELALQVSLEIESLVGDRNVKVLAVYGGAPIMQQIQKLKKGVDIVVGTPGRVIDLLKRKSLKIDKVQYVVLDEADEMLNMGFEEDIKLILQSTPEEKHMLLFSATMPKQIMDIAKKYMKEYDFVEAEKSHLTLDSIEQIYYDINQKDKLDALRRIIDYYDDFYGIIFCNTKMNVDTLIAQLSRMDYKVAALHGDITQAQREKILLQFRKKTVTILIATDVAARGIDVNDLTHVINYSLPQSPESYIHRIGRTGRAGKKGISITFVIPSEKRKLNFVERINKCKLTKAKLPSAKEIIAHKESHIKTILADIIEKSKSKKYDAMAEELLKGNDSTRIVSAVLKYCFKDQLNLDLYKDISEPTSSSERSSLRNSKRGYRGKERRSNSDGRNFRRRDSDRNSRSGRSSSRDSRSGRDSEDRSFNSNKRNSYRGSNRDSNKPDKKGFRENKSFSKGKSNNRKQRRSK